MIMIAVSNIKKKKGVAVSMGLLILLAAAMFNVGITLLAGIGSFYSEENDRLNGPHYVVRFSGNEYSDDYLEYLQQDSRVETVRREEVALMNMASFPEGGVLMADFHRIVPGERKGYVLDKTADVPEEEAIYIPVFMKSLGYGPGDRFTLQFNKQDYSFKVAGYSQSTWFNSSVSSLVDFYMPDAAYENLYAKIGGGYRLVVRLYDENLTEDVQRDFRRDTKIKIESISLDTKIMDITVDEMRTGTTMVVTILSAVLFAFSFLMVIVAVIVIRFRVLNHIDSQMVSIGAMEAMGYTGKQIKWSIALEFLIISIAASFLGILLSYGIIGALGSLITSSVGVQWRSGGHMGYDAASGLILVGIVLFVSQATANRTVKIVPVQALRGGMKSHSFQKSAFPLERVRLELPAALGMKHMEFQKKTYGMVAVIFAGITFACAFSLLIWKNMGLDDTLVLQMTGFEISDITVYAAPHADYVQLKKELEAMEGVRKTSLYETTSIKVEGDLMTCYVSDDYNRLEMVNVYEGEFPMYDNEIVVTGVLAKTWGKKIGDTVTVSVDGRSSDYVICGLTQTVNNFGRQCYLNVDGIRQVNPDYTEKMIQVYMEPGIDVDQQIARMEQEFYVLSPSVKQDGDSGGQDAREAGRSPQETAQDAREAARKKAEEKLTILLSKYGADSAQYALMVDGEVILSGDTGKYEIERIENNKKLYVSSVDSIASSVQIMSVMILIGTVCMITLVFYMVIKSLLVRQKKDFGIYKAIGFTDRQLIRMVAVSFLPAAVIGVAAGCGVACLTVNPVSSMLFEQLGISRMMLVIDPWLMAGMSAAVVLFSYLVAMVSASRIKGITVYGLLTEE